MAAFVSIVFGVILTYLIANYIAKKNLNESLFSAVYHLTHKNEIEEIQQKTQEKTIELFESEIVKRVNAGMDLNRQETIRGIFKAVRGHKHG